MSFNDVGMVKKKKRLQSKKSDAAGMFFWNQLQQSRNKDIDGYSICTIQGTDRILTQRAEVGHHRIFYKYRLCGNPEVRSYRDLLQPTGFLGFIRITLSNLLLIVFFCIKRCCSSCIFHCHASSWQCRSKAHFNAFCRILSLMF